MLNPDLYAAIDRELGPVHIANPGQSTEHGGERYYVTCPICDKPNKLGFSHLYGTKEAGEKWRRLYMCHCHHCEYPHTSDERWALWQQLQQRGGCDFGDYDYNPRIPSSPTQPEPKAEPNPPPAWCRASVMDAPDGVARGYLQKRGFDTEELVERWGLTYQPDRQNLIIPIHNDRPPIRVWGYQSRRLNSGDASLYGKYSFSTGFQKSKYLYGAHRVRNQGGLLVIVEGVTGVWWLGTNTVATFGCSISPDQAQIITRLIEVMERDYVVLFYDGDVQGEKAEKLMHQLRLAASMAKGVTCKVRQVRWPKDATNDDDPCSLTRREAWDKVATACGVNRSKLGV